MSPTDEILKYCYYARKFTNSLLSEAGYDFAIEVDTRKATYRGSVLASLGNYARRKWENIAALSEPKKRIKFLYV